MNPWDVVAWFLNVSSSVVIVFANKKLLDATSGHGFVFATTLCALHFLACAASIWVVQALGLADRAPLPRGEVLLFALVANTSIASLNLSLLVNSVGFYQITKLLIIPCVCVLELVLQKKKLTAEETLSIATVVLGVGIVTVTDVQISMLGLAIAVVAVLSSALQQIMCGTLQRKHLVSSHQLLSNTAHIQGLMLLVVGPLIDQVITEQWVLQYAWSQAAAQQLLLSCALAVLVNISQFMCLGRFSAVSFQVLGHTKTIFVLLASWWVFKEPMVPRKMLGMLLAVAGMAAYGQAAMRHSNAKQKSKQQKDASDADAFANVLVPAVGGGVGKAGRA